MKILYWNIENLTYNKFFDISMREVILQALLGATNPDLIVIVEVFCRATLGQERFNTRIYQTQGTDGLNALFNSVRLYANTYSSVPPVATGCNGYCEAVGFIYNTDVLQFRGPHVWTELGPVPADQLNKSHQQVAWPWSGILKIHSPGQENPQFTPASYPAPWNRYAPFNVVQPQPPAPPIQVPAPQVLFPNPRVRSIAWENIDGTNFYNGFTAFPSWYNRAPVRCLFWHLTQNCYVDVFALHTSPNQTLQNGRVYDPTADRAVEKTGALAEVRNWPEGDTPAVQIILGDFNVTLQSNVLQGTPYQNLGTAGYVPSVWNTPTLFNKYTPVPAGGGYVSQAAGTLDNIFYRRNFPAPAPVTRVVDQVIGTTIADLGLTWTSQLFNNYADLSTCYGGPNQVLKNQALQTFRDWNNFGHIAKCLATAQVAGTGGASDHLPLYIQF